MRFFFRFVWGKNETLKREIFRTAVVTLLLTLSTISILTYAFTRNYLFKEISIYIKDRQADASVGINLLINNLNLSAVSIMTDRVIYNAVNSNDDSYEKRSEIIREQMHSMLGMNQAIGNAVIMTHGGEVFAMNDDHYTPLPDREYFDSILETDNIITMGRIVSDSQGRKQIMLGRRFNWFATSTPIGCLIIYLNESSLSQIYESIIYENGYSFVVSSNNTIISHPDKQLLGLTYPDSYGIIHNKKTDEVIKMSKENKFVVSTVVKDKFSELGLEWNIVTSIDKSHIYNVTRQFDRYIWMIELFVALVALALSVGTGAYILQPLKRLKDSMMRYKADGKTYYKREISESKEILELEKTYLDMVRRIDSLIVKNNEEKEKQRELELTALQAQINPHFLYNTLDTIVWYAKIKEQKEIEKMATALAKFFRMSLHDGDKFITVNAEILLVKSYLIIEQIRFPNKLDISYNIDEEILDHYILKLVLQPIVENALKHGIRGKKDGGKICINGIKEKNYIVFEVIDNGKGFDTSKLKEENPSQNRVGYGLKNVNERLKLEYGEMSGINLYSEVGKGTRVILKIKYK